MLKFALTNKLLNALVKKIVAKFLSKQLGPDSKIEIRKLAAIEENGRLRLTIDADIDISSAIAENIINGL